METTKVEMKEGKRILYTGKTTTVGGRDGGSSVSSDGRLNIRLATPGTAQEGTAQEGTNPEQLFAAGWSACFIGALKLTAAKMKVRFPENGAVDAEVDLVLTGDQYSLRARLHVTLPGVDGDIAKALVETAHATCPYSKATRGNIDVAISIHTDL
ncbi:organic hydroperoxide resistance protein [Chryseolinea sp. T2]|uniref:organic hydroperoxide resistance protein n=1 Tax=Chryseolinea sp. T2 TaxID=3129255 RepID=UPI0030782FD6